MLNPIELLPWYPDVPTSFCSSLVSFLLEEQPKSPNLQTPFDETRMLAGFTSRWTTPAKCTYSRAEAISLFMSVNRLTDLIDFEPVQIG